MVADLIKETSYRHQSLEKPDRVVNWLDREYLYDSAWGYDRFPAVAAEFYE